MCCKDAGTVGRGHGSDRGQEPPCRFTPLQYYYRRVVCMRNTSQEVRRGLTYVTNCIVVVVFLQMTASPCTVQAFKQTLTCLCGTAKR